ncbi:HSP70-domain-containing protein [Piromyces finnis]|uniref:HSP70-domain-containing protein n=1 Tax=Piromyces finnis TaxID=1754191 RepID=A0A1Y1VM60_9FUNG|nr:HSP70-domain-containing protein [Piromyces finnis]|eukprot:ORX60013.1 HSP70-domain-containing protein [Piromyces finnis]
MPKAIGIDLSTTYSCIGIWQNNRVEIIPNDQGHLTMNSQNTVFDAKRLIGRRFNDLEVQSDMKHWSFKKSGKPYIQVEFKGETENFIPEEISFMILTKMKDTAVITVPAYFNDI